MMGTSYINLNSSSLKLELCISVKACLVQVQNTKGREWLIKPATLEGIDVYHLLSGTFCQCVSIAKVRVVNFYVFDVVSVCDINVTIEYCCDRRARRFSGALLK